MNLGPVDYVLLSFEGNRFNGDIVPALRELVDTGTVAILDIVFVTKDGDGNVAWVEFDGLDNELTAGFADIDGDVGGLLSDEDIVLAAESLPANSSAALLVWENSWAARFVAAVRDSGGQVLAQDRIPAAAVEEAFAGLDG